MSKLISKNHQQGFSILEMIVAIAVMAVITGAVFALMRDSVKTSTSSIEMSDGQQSARTAQEYINRDLMNTGDGLNSITNIRVPENFVTNYLALNPVTNPATPGFINLALIISDNDVPANTIVTGTAPAVAVRSTPVLTDRITILQTDQTFVPITLNAADMTIATGAVAVSPADIDRFRVGEIYFLTSSVGSIFAAITDRTGVGSAAPALVFGGDALGLNNVGAGGQLDFVSAGATLPVSLSRMKMIHYYVNSAGLLMRRVFGVRNAPFNESMISEHVVSLQFRYFLNMRDANGNVMQPLNRLTTSQQQVETRQVETTLTVETAHALQNGQRQQMSMTTSTSVRNMQFRQSLQPTGGG
ncbi:MAG TPA: prepilin-type N-terminal cleavage/methylation domain-containing protein [Pyrinomonadaceae bacterium]|nr:prepilin-type N-terminal cleavage/methylation domain-containing protein [Pyrinomonadaceae bacterium]